MKSPADGGCVTYADVQMHERYLDMQIRNRNHHERNRASVNENNPVRLDPALLTASFQNVRGRYISIENTVSAVSRLNSLEPRSHDELLGIPKEMKDVNQSSDSREFKRFLSDPGEDPTELMQPNPYHTLPKSYSNPGYMTDQNILKIDRPSYLESVKNDYTN